MPFLKNINELRNISFGKSFLWDFRIDGAPSPFNNWFPAIDIEENVANLESFTFDAYNTSFKVPLKKTLLDVKVTFIDDEKNTALSFFTDWIRNTIFGEDSNVGSTTATLEESSKIIQILKLNNQRETLLESSYRVYPEGPLVFRGNSDSGNRIQQVTLPIVGTISVGERDG